jgi:hypothetical protein
MVLAIEADGVSYRDSSSTRDRDRLRKEHLERLGWTFHRIWSTNWFHDPESEIAKVHQAYRDAVAKVEPPAEPGPDPAESSGSSGAPDSPSAPGQTIALREPVQPLVQPGTGEPLGET